MIQFGIIGAGWRAEFFLRIAQACKERFRVIGLVGRDPTRAAGVAQRFQVPLFSSVEDLVKQGQPQFVVVSISRGANLPLLAQLAHLNVPVLVETPPAETVDDLRAVWALLEAGARIQVAEQYWAQPLHSARLALAKSGKLGRVTQAQISVAHGYHGISLMRRFLGVGFEPVTVTASSSTSPIVEGSGPTGLPARETVVSSRQVVARFDFADRVGIYDFAYDQYFSLFRGLHVLVRGDRGEIADETAVYLHDFRTPIRVAFVRHSAGPNGNLEGNYLKGIQVGEQWMYSNPLIPAALSDDEIAIGTCLLRMADYVSGGPPFYSYAEAAQDRYLDLLMEQALESGGSAVSQPQPWQR